MNWFESLPSSPVVTLVLLTLAVAAIVLAIVLYFKARRVRALSWAISTTTVIGPNTPPLPALSIHYAQEAIGTLSISSVSIWNAGTESISGRDISPAVPLALAATREDVRILDCTVTLASNKAAGIATQHKDHTHVDICFHYLNTRDGCVMRVIHTGTTSDDLTVSGGIQGVKTINRMRVTDPRLQSVARRRTFVIGALLAIVMVLVFPVPVPGHSTPLGDWVYVRDLPGRFRLAVWIAIAFNCLVLLPLAYLIMEKYIGPRMQSVPTEFNVAIRP